MDVLMMCSDDENEDDIAIFSYQEKLMSDIFQIIFLCKNEKRKMKNDYSK